MIIGLNFSKYFAFFIPDLTLSREINLVHVMWGITPNGPAIKGGCVTWRSHPATCPGALATK
jgi:hypothetical protein